MAELAVSPLHVSTASPASSATLHSDSSPRPSLIPLVSFSSSSPPTTSSTRTFFPSSNPPPSSFKLQHKKKAPLTPIPARLLQSANRENDSSQANRPPPPTRLLTSPSLKQRDEKAEAMRLLCQRPVAGEVRGERRAGGRSDKQYSDDMLVLAQLPALIEAGQLAGSMDRVFRLLADSIENPRSKQASTALALLPQLLLSNVQAATASVSTLLSSLLHCYLHGEKFLQRDVPPLLHQCMALSGGRSVAFFGGKERGGSKNVRERATSACMLHATLSLFTATEFTAYDGCSSCPSTPSLPPSHSHSAFSVSSLPLAELTAVLCTLHSFVSDGQASTRYHSRHAISLLCTHTAPLTLDVALKALPFEHAAAIKAIAHSPSPTTATTTISSPSSSPPSSTRQRHNTMPSPTPPPSASPPRLYATLPDEREWEEWKQQPGLVSPIKCDPLPDTEVEADVAALDTTPTHPTHSTHEQYGQAEDDEVVVRVHSTRAAVSPVPFVRGADDDEEEDEITVVVAADERRRVEHGDECDSTAADQSEEAVVVVTVLQSTGESQLSTAIVSRPTSAIEVEAVESEAAEHNDDDAPSSNIHPPLPFTPVRSSHAPLDRLSIKRKRSESPLPIQREADKEQQPPYITSATQWLQLCRAEQASGSSSHKRVVEVSGAAVEWLVRSRQEASGRGETEQCVMAAERQMSRMAAMMERLKATANVVRRTLRSEVTADGENA